MKKEFDIVLHSDIRFGFGKVHEIGKIAGKYGKKTMVVTCPWPQVQADIFRKIIETIEEAGVEVVLYDRAVPNPTVDSIEEAAEIARREKVTSIVGLGGGSAMDTAKGVSLCYAHEEGIWEYTYVAKRFLPIYEEKLLPVIAVTTTSGTGSQVTPYCVLQDPKRKVKTCVVADMAMLPRVSIVDPDLMMTMPPFITATTGFDVFAHAFESYMDKNSNPLIEVLALKAIELCLNNLERACQDGTDREARLQMAQADIWGGMCISMNNTTMPHDIGQAIVGKNPRVAHGLSVAMVFPEYIECLNRQGKSREKMEKIAALFKSSQGIEECSAEQLGKQIVQWEKRLGIFSSGEDLGLSGEIEEAVVEETVNTCPFLTQECQCGREEIKAVIHRIWKGGID